MPMTAVPAAPMPVHTAYADPTSSLRSATVSSAKLASAHAAKTAVGQIRVIPWLIFSATAKPVSNRPAATRITHALVSPRPSVAGFIGRGRGIPVDRRWSPDGGWLAEVSGQEGERRLLLLRGE